MKSNKYETIIINSFMHSLPDIRFDILKLIYQIDKALCSLNKTNDAITVNFNLFPLKLISFKFYE